MQSKLTLKCWKNSFWSKKRLKEMLLFYTHSTAILPNLGFFSIKTFFFRKTQLLCALKRSTISFAFYSKFDNFWWSKILQVTKCTIFDFHAFLQMASKRKEIQRVECMIFLPCYKYGEKILKKGLWLRISFFRLQSQPIKSKACSRAELCWLWRGSWLPVWLLDQQ